MDFPADRFVRAGATPEQLEQHQASFDAMPLVAQESFVAAIAASSDYQIAELLNAPAPEAEPVAEPEPAPAPPAASSASTSSSSKTTAPADGNE